jgi:hypothetical protein
VVLASAMLAMVATAIFSAIGYVQRADQRWTKRLAAHEVANRLVLQFLDDESSMPDQSRPYEDGTYTFRWSLRKVPVTLESDTNERNALLEDTVLIRAEVYEGLKLPTGEVERGETLAVLDRFFNAYIIFTRNEDARARNLSNPAFLQDLMRRTPGGPSGGAGRPVPAPAAPKGTPAPGKRGTP